MDYIGVFLVDLPARIDGMTLRNADGSFTILINAGLSSIAQCRAYDHEMDHINNHDYDQMYDVDDLERLRHSA